MIPPDWQTRIADPADKATEGRREVREGDLSACYEVAPLPKGWAVQVECRGDAGCGMTIPWRQKETREECVAFFLAEARAFFGHEWAVRKGQERARKRMLELLAGGDLFSRFEEPEPRGA